MMHDQPGRDNGAPAAPEEYHEMIARAESGQLQVLLIESTHAAADAALLAAFMPDATHAPAAGVFDVTQSSSVTEALERLERGGVDLIVLDLGGAEEGDFAALDRLRGRVPDLPLVVTTELADERVALEALRRGAQDCIPKGAMDATSLARAIRYAIERHRMHTTLQHLSLRDRLTGLYNRAGFLMLSDHHLKRLSRTRGMLLVTVDIDGLASINDAYGYRDGDRLLNETAMMLRSSFRASDVVGRLGEDEFGVLVLDAGDDTAELVTARLEERVAEHAILAGTSAPLDLTIAVTRFAPESTTCIDDLLVLSDWSIYEQKRGKRGGR